MSYALARTNWSPRARSAAGAIGSTVTEPIPVNQPAVSRSSTGSAPDWSRSFENRAQELLQLRPNWDNRGSATPRIDALSFAYSVLSEAMAPTTASPSVIPLSNGGVQLVWAGNQVDVEVEVMHPNQALVYSLDHQSGVETEWQLTTEFSPLSALLRSKFTA